MLRAERRQVRYDFGVVPELVKRYIPEAEQADALQMCRHVNVVTTYLSGMATDEPRHFEGVIYALAIAGMDAVTDHRNEKVAGGRTADALAGDPDYPELEPLEMASEVALGHRFDYAVTKVAEWQDESLRQFDEPDEANLHAITEMKGGFSALAHLHALKESPDADEEEFIMEFGAVMQLLDDYLDQPDDAAAGVTTLFTAGHMDRDELASRTERMLDWAKKLYGESAALSRLGRILRLHMRLGDVANRTPLDPATVVPWYL